jgi:hypothetical protein
MWFGLSQYEDHIRHSQRTVSCDKECQVTLLLQKQYSTCYCFVKEFRLLFESIGIEATVR